MIDFREDIFGLGFFFFLLGSFVGFFCTVVTYVLYDNVRRHIGMGSVSFYDYCSVFEIKVSDAHELLMIDLPYGCYYFCLHCYTLSGERLLTLLQTQPR